MPPYDDWNKLDDDDEDELQDNSFYEGKRDVILFCIDCSESMHELRDHPNDHARKTCHLYTALDAAVQIQKRKVIVGPNDAVGILLFNTTTQSEVSTGRGAEIKNYNFVYQPVSQVNAPQIKKLMRTLEEFRNNPTTLRNAFPPLEGRRAAMGDVFTSCNWVIRDGAPKTATKRVFLITDEDDPHPGAAKERLTVSSRTTLIDLTQAGVTVEPFFVSTPDKPFDSGRFYSSVLQPDSFIEDDEEPDDPSVLPESISITRIDDLLSQMRFHESPKRALFSVPFQLAEGFTIGVKGYGLVTEQKKGAYKYFVDLGERMEMVSSRTVYTDEVTQKGVDKPQLMYGMTLGGTVEPAEGDDDPGFGARMVSGKSKVFYTADEVKSFRTMGLEPGLRLLGFKNKSELAIEDNIKHSTFIYPDEMSFSGSKRTFSALLKSLVKKNKIGIVLAILRRNSAPYFYAMIPQAEVIDESGWNEPPGFHLIPLPFADDIRAAPIEEGQQASEELKDAAKAWINKLVVKNGGYPPDAYPNPALAYHYAQLQASAFREDFDPADFEDLTLPKYNVIHKRAGPLIKAWKEALREHKSAEFVSAPLTGTKRKADVSVGDAEVKERYESGTLTKLRNDQLKDFLKSKSLPVSGKKADLIDRVTEYLDKHS